VSSFLSCRAAAQRSGNIKPPRGSFLSHPNTHPPPPRNKADHARRNRARAAAPAEQGPGPHARNAHHRQQPSEHGQSRRPRTDHTPSAPTRTQPTTATHTHRKRQPHQPPRKRTTAHHPTATQPKQGPPTTQHHPPPHAGCTPWLSRGGPRLRGPFTARV